MKKSYSKLIRNIKNNYQLHLIILVPLAFLFVFSYLPMLGAQIAFKEFDPSKGIWGSPWIGFQYFQRFITAYDFWKVIKNTVTISLYCLLVGTPAPIILALSLNNCDMPRFRKFIQTATYAPYFISTVVIVGMILLLFSPSTGVYGYICNMVGIKPLNLTGDVAYFSHLYTWSNVWQGLGWGAVIYIAVLAGVDRSVYEAALIDGASKFQRTIHIDLPSLIPTVTIMFILGIGMTLNIGFEKIYLMQNPANMGASEVINTYVYKVAFRTDVANYSYASAIGLFNSIVNFTLVILANLVARRIGNASLW